MKDATLKRAVKILALIQAVLFAVCVLVLLFESDERSLPRTPSGSESR
jgi:hypothetical protein